MFACGLPSKGERIIIESEAVRQAGASGATCGRSLNQRKVRHVFAENGGPNPANSILAL